MSKRQIMATKEVFNQYQDMAGKLQDQTFPGFNMLKVLENYRKSVDYYNSYGLKKRPMTAHELNFGRN